MVGVSLLMLSALASSVAIAGAGSGGIRSFIPVLTVSLQKTGLVTSESFLRAAADPLRVREYLDLGDRYAGYLGKHVRFHSKEKKRIYGGQVLGYSIDTNNQPSFEVHLYDDLYPEDVDRVQNIHPHQVTGTLMYYQHPHVGSEVEVAKLWSSIVDDTVGGEGIILGTYEDEPWIHEDCGRYALKIKHNKQNLLVFSDDITPLP